jgi:hypothetical protein
MTTQQHPRRIYETQIERRLVQVLKATTVVVAALLLLSGCAAGANPLVGTSREGEYSAGFLMGLWHGIIFPFALIASLVADSVSVYEVRNNGGWYNLGYLFGLGMTFGGGGKQIITRYRYTTDRRLDGTEAK